MAEFLVALSKPILVLKILDLPVESLVKVRKACLSNELS